MNKSLIEITEAIKTVEELKRVRVVLLGKIVSLGGTDCKSYHINARDAREYDLRIGSLLSCVLGMYEEINRLNKRLTH